MKFLIDDRLTQVGSGEEWNPKELDLLFNTEGIIPAGRIRDRYA
jgi:hypothetical protein